MRPAYVSSSVALVFALYAYEAVVASSSVLVFPAPPPGTGQADTLNRVAWTIVGGVLLLVDIVVLVRARGHERDEYTHRQRALASKPTRNARRASAIVAIVQGAFVLALVLALADVIVLRDALAVQLAGAFVVLTGYAVSNFPFGALPRREPAPRGRVGDEGVVVIRR